MRVAVLAWLMLVIQDNEADTLLNDLGQADAERRTIAFERLCVFQLESQDLDRKLESLERGGASDVSTKANQILKVRRAARTLVDPQRVLKRLSSRDDGVRLATIQSLGKRGGAAAVLVRGLVRDEVFAIQQAAVQILLASNDIQFLPDLQEFAQHPQLSQMVLPWLAAHGDVSVAPHLRTRVQRGETWALEPLMQLRLPDDIQTIRAFMSDYPDAAAFGLKAIREWGEAKRQLGNDIRQLAILGINEAILLSANVSDPEFKKELLRLCELQSSAAAFVLGAQGDAASIPYLLRLVRYNKLQSAIGLLGRMKVREAVHVFQRVLGDSAGVEYRVRAAYAIALGDIGGLEAEGILIKLTQDPTEEVRYEAVSSLGRLKCERALEPILQLLDDAVAFVRFTPLPPSASIVELYENKVSTTKWCQVREAALVALEAITSEPRKKGTMFEQAEAWRLWWASRSRLGR